MEINFYESPQIDISRETKFHSSMPAQHYHNGFEIFYLISGSINYFIEDQVYSVVRGVLLFININEIHKLVNSSGESFERITLVFKKDFVDALFPNHDTFDVLSTFLTGKHMMRLGRQEQTFVEQLFDKMIHEFNNQPPGYEFYLKTLLFELLIFMYRKNESDSIERTETHSVHHKVFKIVNYINHHYQQPLTISHIASEFYISPSYFCKLFRDNTGFTFTEYVNNVRVKEARVLLTQSRMKVADISERVGYESLTHFGRIFKEITGLSPLKYRQTFTSGPSSIFG
ncbi:AraC family transcriptional regulator [Paenibacillus paridis]|uniref:AraC family transcriptional regulator n=1 Tax=Paenibacillus paridis TaxID=2583376 RepID=UPI00111CDEC8|nr:AraC family transcriptional regulator [Paenibacillus paridis]